MGRHRRHAIGLPALLYAKTRGGVTRYYYGRNGLALGSDLKAALHKHAELYAGTADAGTFHEAARLYRADKTHGLASKAPKTQREYARQLVTLESVFGEQPLDHITPGDVQDFLDARPKHAGTREKALLSAVFTHARTRSKITAAPNPCAGVRGAKARRDRLVTDAELAAVLAKADPDLAAFLELAWRTGADASVVLALRRSDIQDGCLHIQRTKTGAKVRVLLEGPLAALIDRLLRDTVGDVRLLRSGASMALQALRRRFWTARKAAGQDWQIRDLRAKAASDADDIRHANELLGHGSEQTTAGYRRQVAGARVRGIGKDTPRG